MIRNSTDRLAAIASKGPIWNLFSGVGIVLPPWALKNLIQQNFI